MVSKVGGPPGGKPPGTAPAGDDGEEDSAIYNQLKKFINVIVSSQVNSNSSRASNERLFVRIGLL